MMTLRDGAIIYYARHSLMTPAKIMRVIEAADAEGEWDIDLKPARAMEIHFAGVMDRHGGA